MLHHQTWSFLCVGGWGGGWFALFCLFFQSLPYNPGWLQTCNSPASWVLRSQVSTAMPVVTPVAIIIIIVLTFPRSCGKRTLPSIREVPSPWKAVMKCVLLIFTFKPHHSPLPASESR